MAGDGKLNFKTVLKFLLVFAAGVLFFFGLKVGKLLTTDVPTNTGGIEFNITEDVETTDEGVIVAKDEGGKEIKYDFAYYKGINPDTKMLINMSSFSAPVVQSQDNKDYMRTNFWGGEDPMGTLFLDAEVLRGNTKQDTNQIIQGHSSRRTDTMLTNMKDPNFVKANETFTIETEEGLKEFHIISYFDIRLKDNPYKDFLTARHRNRSDLKRTAAGSLEHSKIDFSHNVKDNFKDMDELVTLITCDVSDEYGTIDDTHQPRYVIMAVSYNK